MIIIILKMIQYTFNRFDYLFTFIFILINVIIFKTNKSIAVNYF